MCSQLLIVQDGRIWRGGGGSVGATAELPGSCLPGSGYWERHRKIFRCQNNEIQIYAKRAENQGKTQKYFH